jgi:hypothetical protein
MDGAKHSIEELLPEVKEIPIVKTISSYFGGYLRENTDNQSLLRPIQESNEGGLVYRSFLEWM